MLEKIVCILYRKKMKKGFLLELKITDNVFLRGIMTDYNLNNISRK